LRAVGSNHLSHFPLIAAAALTNATGWGGSTGVLEFKTCMEAWVASGTAPWIRARALEAFLCGFSDFGRRIMTNTRGIAGACLIALVSCSGARGDDGQDNGNKSSAEKVLASLAGAYNAQDSKAIADQFTQTGEFIDADGDVFDGREVIAREFAALFEVKPRDTVAFDVNQVREISPGTLSVESAATFSSSDGSKTSTVDFTALVVRQSDGRGLLASVRSQGERSARTPGMRLKELEWLIGLWVDESDESTMNSNTRWSEDGNFLVTSFTIQVARRKVLSGTQWIGWDGSLEKFRSWVFDSDGGHAEGIWTRIDDRWIVKSTGVRPDGDACSATNTYERKGPDAFLFSVTDRIVGHETLADFTSHVVRKPPDPKTASNAAAPLPGKGTP
jgi:uncharacterized protein (TIGR02246 family)